MTQKLIYMTDYDFKRLRGILRSLKNAGKAGSARLETLSRELDRAAVVPASMIPALIGKLAGTEVECEVPGGVMKLRIDEVVYQPEAEGAYTL